MIKIGNEIKTITHILTDGGFMIKVGVYFDRVRIEGPYVEIHIVGSSRIWNKIDFDSEEYMEFKDRLNDICDESKLYLWYKTEDRNDTQPANKYLGNQIVISSHPNMKNFMYMERREEDYIPIIKFL